MLLKRIKSDNKGNISFLALTVVLIISLLLLLIFDISQVFVAREVTRNAADSIALSIAQDLLFFDEGKIKERALEIAGESGCSISGIWYDYDIVKVEVSKELKFIIIGKIFPGYKKLSSFSKTQVIFPWDDNLGYLKSYKFGY